MDSVPVKSGVWPVVYLNIQGGNIKHKIYEKPVIEFMGFGENDVITTSVEEDDTLYTYRDPFDEWGL